MGPTGATGATGVGVVITDIGNTAVGAQALVNNTGNDNTATGFQSLLGNTTGSNNTANGIQALHDNTMGFNNTAYGFQALFSNAGGGGIEGNLNTANGSQALGSNTTGSNNTANGSRTLLGNSTGSNNTAIGFQADVAGSNLTNATAIGANAVVNASNKVRIGNTAVTVIEGQVAFTFPSDRNKKENFQPVDGEEVLRKIRQFNLTSWNYIGQDAKTLRHYGPMAQDFYDAFGHDAIGTAGTPTTINSGDMAGVMMIAIKALATENVQLKSAVAKQEAVNAEQRKRLEALTARFEEQAAQIQKVSAQLEASKPAPQVVNNP
jgi:hypothetical protein